MVTQDLILATRDRLPRLACHRERPRVHRGARGRPHPRQLPCHRLARAADASISLERPHLVARARRRQRPSSKDEPAGSSRPDDQGGAPDDPARSARRPPSRREPTLHARSPRSSASRPILPKSPGTSSRATKTPRRRPEAGSSSEINGPTVGWWDRGRLDQVVTNLLGNAVKYGGGAPITVSVSSGSSGHVRLIVRDEGPGIPLEHQERIFGQFERATDSENLPGMGLGLWLVRRILTAHGGAISVDSVPEQGATFCVFLPVGEQASDAPRKLARPFLRTDGGYMTGATTIVLASTFSSSRTTRISAIPFARRSSSRATSPSPSRMVGRRCATSRPGPSRA